MKKRLLITLAAVISAAGNSLAAERRLAPELETAGSTPGAESIQVIVQFRETPGREHYNRILNLGGTLRRELRSLKGGVYTLPPASLKALAADPDVLYIAPDRPVRGMMDVAASSVGANIAWQSGWTGNQIGVAIIDSGVSPHWDLKKPEGPVSLGGGLSRIVYNESFLPSTAAGNYMSTTDEYGHGTHVAGIVAGDGFSSSVSNPKFTIKGIAPKANIINLRVLDANGAGRDSDVIRAIERAIELRAQYNIKVINLSLGRPVFESYRYDPLCQAVERAWKAGIVVVVAAGNSGRNNSQGTNGYATISSPGNDPYVITVGAMKTMHTPTRADDLVASYSSKGPTLLDHIVKPDIVAPGNRMVSLVYNITTVLGAHYSQNVVPFSYYLNGGNNTLSYTYLWLSGTSMATPVVSGAVAVLLEQSPNLTPDQVKARLMKTASKSFPSSSVVTDQSTGIAYVSQYDVFTIGAGYLDLGAAIASRDVAPGTGHVTRSAI